MPELPEVETTVRLVRPHVVGRRVNTADVAWGRTVAPLKPAAFRHAVSGTRIRSLERRAKFAVARLSRGGAEAGALLVHLRMSGRLVVDPAAAPPRPYQRLSLDLEGGTTVRFLDVRKFGRVRHVTDPDRALAHLGPEPLEAGFTAARFHEALHRRRRRLKPLLLDQTFVAGLGNIYVDEALHRARLHPLRRADTLRRAQVEALHEAVLDVLRGAIARQGSSFDGFYRTPEGQPGRYQHEFRVYGRAGRPCPRCEAPIRRLVVGQRGTHVCLRCQRTPRRP